MRPELNVEIPKAEGFEELVIYEKPEKLHDIGTVFFHRRQHGREIIRTVEIVVVELRDDGGACFADEMISLAASRKFLARMFVDNARVGQALHELRRSRTVVEHQPLEIGNVLIQNELCRERKKMMPIRCRRNDAYNRRPH